MKPAHWTKIAQSLGKKYGLEWSKAREAYKLLKDTASRKPSLRMVSALPPKLPAKLKGARKKKTGKPSPVANPAKPAKPTKPAPALPGAKPPPAPPGAKPKIVLAPDLSIGPRPVPKQQSARNKFEQMLLDANLPVAALGRGEVGKQIAKNWRNEKQLKTIANLLQTAYKQIERTTKYGFSGYMLEQTKKRLFDKIENLLGVKQANIIWFGIFKQLYGVSPKK